jgi:hypothetical protein
MALGEEFSMGDNLDFSVYSTNFRNSSTVSLLSGSTDHRRITRSITPRIQALHKVFEVEDANGNVNGNVNIKEAEKVNKHDTASTSDTKVENLANTFSSKYT